MRYQKNQILEVEIIDLNMMGFGVAKVDGAVFFVQNGVVGDRARIRVIKEAKQYYVARIEELLVPSKDREEPRCSVFRRCGGCSFCHVNYSLERDVKKRYVESCFQKNGLATAKVNDVLSTNSIEGYRNKAQFPLAFDSEGNPFFGFYSPRTHSVCKTEDCKIQDPAFNKIAIAVTDFFKRERISIYNEESGKGLVRHIYLRKGKKTGEIMLCLVLSEDQFPKEDKFVKELTNLFPEITGIVFNVNSKQTNVILGKTCRTVWGKDKIQDVLCDRKLSLSPLSFYQVNRDAAELLYQTAFQMAGLDEHDVVLDLYCGIGSIALSAAGGGRRVIGVEIVEEAVLDAKENARMNHISDAEFYCGDAADAFRIVRDLNAKNPLIIVDPPRKGLSEKLIRDIAEQDFAKVLYISCGPDTLARDVKLFCELGYQMSEVQPVDLFPRTSHVETVVLLYK